nr:MAG TPA: hypothetical protein [Caudoviricetes sp.]
MKYIIFPTANLNEIPQEVLDELPLFRERVLTVRR